jgi:hypothetical protein
MWQYVRNKKSVDGARDQLCGTSLFDRQKLQKAVRQDQKFYENNQEFLSFFLPVYPHLKRESGEK